MDLAYENGKLYCFSNLPQFHLTNTQLRTHFVHLSNALADVIDYHTAVFAQRDVDVDLPNGKFALRRFAYNHSFDLGRIKKIMRRRLAITIRRSAVTPHDAAVVLYHKLDLDV